MLTRDLWQNTLTETVAQIRGCGKIVVFTNGCYDGLHEGHRRCIHEAKHQGDVLVVAVNNDSSIRKLKGPERPKHRLVDRVWVLMKLDEVDFLLTFGDPTPIKLIEAIRPDVLVKGGDYTKAQVVGWEFVESYGGRVHLTDSVIVKGRVTV